MNPRLIICAGVLLSILSASAEDWPQWRGPRHDGVSTEKGLANTWPAGGPSLKWKATGVGNGYSTVSVAKGLVVTIGDQGDFSYVSAWKESDGQKQWQVKLDKSGSVGWGNFEGPRSAPAIDGDLIFALSQHGELLCIERGKEKWRKHLVNDLHGVLMEWGYSESPIVDGDKVLCTPGGPEGAVVALNKKTGEVIWRSTEFTDKAHYSSLIVEQINGVRQYILLTADSVAGIKADDGKLLWRAIRKGSTAVIPTPVYYDNYVFVSSSYGTGCNLFKITENGGKFQAEQVYANKLMKNHHGGVLRIGDYVYATSDPSGALVCLEMKTGKLAWEEKSIGKGSLAYADGHFYLRKEDKEGTVALIEANPKEYKEIAKFNPPDRSQKNSWAHPVIANGKLYLRDQDVLLCYDLKK
jgi:outer membrane protein assembly factor BamB